MVIFKTSYYKDYIPRTMTSVPDFMDFLQEPAEKSSFQAGKWYEGGSSNTVIMSGGRILAAMVGSG